MYLMKTRFWLLIFLFSSKFLFAQTYLPTWESIDQRPVPEWFKNAKFGIFIHWGPYSVPAYRETNYAEWYAHAVMNRSGENFHDKMFGEDFEYRNFGKMFKAELFEPTKWAELFQKSGAKYVVLTSKHHDGFCLWPATSPYSKNWNASDIGPQRDLVGDLTKAVRNIGLKMGLYFSLLEWETSTPNKTWLNHKTSNRYNIPYKDFYPKHLVPQLKELVTNYQPSIIWSDGEWEKEEIVGPYTKEFMAWLYNNAPNKNEVVVNDRWLNTSGKHGDFFSHEYNPNAKTSLDKPWEEIQGIGSSFGYNRMERAKDYRSAEKLIHLLVSCVSKGGNLLLNIGPAADGTIPVIMEERLLQIGEWLAINGEAIYDTEGWSKLDKQTLEPELKVNENAQNIAEYIDEMYKKIYRRSTYFTKKGNTLYAISIKPSEKPIEIVAVKANAKTQVSLLGYEGKIDWKYDEKAEKIMINFPIIPNYKTKLKYAYSFKITNLEN